MRYVQNQETMDPSIVISLRPYLSVLNFLLINTATITIMAINNGHKENGWLLTIGILLLIAQNSAFAYLVLGNPGLASRDTMVHTASHLNKVRFLK